MNVILIDDEQLALDYFEYQLKSVSDYKVIGKYTDPFAGKQAIEEADVDLVFLDIEIPDLSGIELAEQILEIKPNLPIVFVTAYDDYAIKAFELNAMDYVLKPVSADRLLRTISRIKKNEIKEYSKPNESKVKLQLNLFHQVTLLDESNHKANPISLKWRTTKAEHLFLYLVQHKDIEVSKSLLVDLIWPDLEPQKAYQQLYTAIYNVRKVLAQYSEHFKIKSIRDGYILTLENVTIDVVQFERFINSVVPLSRETVSDYEHILQMYTGHYLELYDFVWIESERRYLQEKWIETALKVANWYVGRKEYEKSLSLLDNICRRFPVEEEAHFFIMKIQSIIGNNSAVHRQFLILKESLLSELQIDPRADIVDWYDSWKEDPTKPAYNRQLTT